MNIASNSFNFDIVTEILRQMVTMLPLARLKKRGFRFGVSQAIFVINFRWF